MQLAQVNAALVPSARIGPNAITRVADALRHEENERKARDVFAAAGLAHYLRTPPEAMVDEDEVIRLHRALQDVLGRSRARRIAAGAGTATGAYLLEHRIPPAARALLHVLPAGLAARILLSAIRRHAWTFTGSGSFDARAGRPLNLRITDNPLCRGKVADEPQCDYYAATFERVFRALVHPRAVVIETECGACGADACRFEVHW